ncbi:hypothetical protein E2C01_057877 [Portunus trituberculatus]|uniref:Uncharacterized protein n=1 Tax=Portunus trituberculatus TaxID=210409 RepID=A0A5B7H4K1_PORTR|nr:hypothetical protein [Portunus trituberculatus]
MQWAQVQEATLNPRVHVNCTRGGAASREAKALPEPSSLDGTLSLLTLSASRHALADPAIQHLLPNYHNYLSPGD